MFVGFKLEEGRKRKRAYLSILFFPRVVFLAVIIFRVFDVKRFYVQNTIPQHAI